MIDLIDPNPVPWKKIIIVSAIVLILISTIVVLNMQYGLTLRVLFKDKLGVVEEGGNNNKQKMMLFKMYL